MKYKKGLKSKLKIRGIIGNERERKRRKSKMKEKKCVE